MPPAATLLAVSAFIGFTKAQEAQGAMATATAKLQSRKNAVLVFGATGKLGREIVSQVLLHFLFFKGIAPPLPKSWTGPVHFAAVPHIFRMSAFAAVCVDYSVRVH